MGKKKARISRSLLWTAGPLALAGISLCAALRRNSAELPTWGARTNKLRVSTVPLLTEPITFSMPEKDSPPVPPILPPPRDPALADIRLKQLLETPAGQDHGVPFLAIRQQHELLAQFNHLLQAEDPRATAFLMRAASDIALRNAANERSKISTESLREWLWTTPVVLDRFERFGREGALADVWKERFEGNSDALYEILVTRISHKNLKAAFENIPGGVKTEIELRLLHDYRRWRNQEITINSSQWQLIDSLSRRYGLSGTSPPRFEPTSG